MERRHNHLTRAKHLRFARRLTALAIIACSASIATAQNAQTPSYISSLADFEVRALTGQFQPSNGMQTMAAATPQEWLNSDPGSGLKGVIIAWSGGAKPTTGTKMFVHGGGHNDSANNGLYVFDFAGSDAPTGWSIADISSVSAVRVAEAYADGKPAAVHTYDGLVYAQHNNHIYRFAGAIWNPGGGFTRSTWKYNVANNSWTKLPSYSGRLNTGASIYDPASRKILVGFGSQFEVAFFRTDQDQWSSVKSTNGSFIGSDTTGAYDPTRSRGVMVGDGASRLIDIDWNRETVDVSVLSASGATNILNTNGPSVVYDPLRDSYWIFAGSESSPGFGSIYEMDADALTIQRHTLGGDNIAVESSLRGSYGRFILMPEWRAIGIVASHESPAYVIKLPSADAAPIVKPLPPTDVSAGDQTR